MKKFPLTAGLTLPHEKPAQALAGTGQGFTQFMRW